MHRFSRLVFAVAVLSTKMLSPAAFAEKKVVAPPEFAGQGGDALPFSPGILDGGTLYVSGQIGADLKTRKVPSDFETEVKTCLQNIRLILKAADMDFQNLDSVQIFLTDISLFARMNAVYASLIKDPRPARYTIGVAALAVKDAHIEISATARK
jgi:2-iminobutanoate/2-iminopropanoate deaminase